MKKKLAVIKNIISAALLMCALILPLAGGVFSKVNSFAGSFYRQVFASAASDREHRTVLLGGELVGIRLYTDGIAVSGTEEFLSESGTVSPAIKSGLRVGDVITGANGKKLDSTKELTELIEANKNATLELDVIRDKNSFIAYVTPEKSLVTGQYKCGMWLRDSIGGIGTLTYWDAKSGTVGALGHGITDEQLPPELPVREGRLSSAVLGSVTISAPGAPGQISGALSEDTLADLTVNNDHGVFGTFTGTMAAKNGYEIEAAFADEVKKGYAQIVCTVKNGEKQYYDIEIEKLEISDKTGQRDMVIKVTDPKLLAVTGGIIQGMSGSPIVQNGRLVGAVTHVFVNDPKRGYGIFAQKMLAESDLLIAQNRTAA